MAIDVEKKAKEMADRTACTYQENLADAMEMFERIYHDFFIAGAEGKDYARLHNDLDVNEIVNDLLSSAYDIGKGEYDEA